MKKHVFAILSRAAVAAGFLALSSPAFSQSGNVGIGTTTPQSKLDVSGDMRLKHGSAVNTISTDTAFTQNADSVLATQKAIRAFLKGGNWYGTIPLSANAPAPVSSLTTNLNQPYSVAVQGSYAYVASLNNSRLCIYDISDPAAIVAKGFTDANLYVPRSVAVQGSYAYVASQNSNSLCIYDISDPTNIIAKGFTSANLSGPVSVAVQGSYAYVASGSFANSRLCIYDISDPANIVAKGYTDANLFFAQSVAVQGSYAYVASAVNHRLCIYDISDPANIIAKGFTSANLFTPYSVAVQGSYAYVASTNNDRLCIYDISDPNNIVAKGFTSANLSSPQSVVVQGSYAYVASYNNNRMCIYDISNPANIVAKGFTSANLSNPQSVTAQGSYAYVASYGNNRLSVFEIHSGTPVLAPAPGGGVQAATLPVPWAESGGNVYRNTGNVGIGTATPAAKLDVAGDVRATGKIRMTGTNDTLASASNLIVHANDNNGTGHMAFVVGTAERMRIAANGNVSIGTTASPSPLMLNGGGGDAFTILAGGDVRIFNDNSTASALLYANGGTGVNNATLTMLSDGKSFNFNGTGGSVSSDRRLKQDITPLENSLEKVLRLNGYTYRFKTKAHVAQKEVGVIAQEVQAALPEAVSENADGTLAVSYNALVPLLINAVKEQQAMIDAQQKRVAELEAKEAAYAEMAGQLKELQQMLGVKPKTAGSKVGKQ